MPIRVIPRLDIKGPNLVKGVQMDGLRVLGKPETFARHYYEHGADELLYMDVVASLYGRASMLAIVERTSGATFIPLTVGGGLRTIEDIRAVLKAGADKVAINTAAVQRPDFIREAAVRFGSSTIVVSIEAKRKTDGQYEAYVDSGRERTGLDAFDWAQRAVGLGAGEIMITSIDRDGTGRGYDIALTRQLADGVPVPVVACGGAGTIDHICEVLVHGHADAVCVASVLHYHLLGSMLDSGEALGRAPRAQPLSGTRGSSGIHPASLPEIKRGIAEHGVPCRPVPRQE